MKAEIKQTFTTAERVSIRDALVRYMTERAIGAPTLYAEICKHDPLKREMAMRTLQRYLARAHQTQDHNVSMCHEFAKTLPYFHEEGSLAVLGLSLASFYGVTPWTELSWSLTEKSIFHVRFADKHVWGAKDIPEGREEPFEDHLPHSVVILEPSDDVRFAMCSEIIQNRYARPSSSRFPHYHAKGIAFPVEPRVLMHVMRDSLTRRPRVALWTADEEGDEDTLLLVSYSDSEEGDELTLPVVARTLRAKPERKIPASEINF